jgi:hypothetical protein
VVLPTSVTTALLMVVSDIVIPPRVVL